MKSLVFHNTTFHPVVRNGQPWLTAAEIAEALGYSRADKITQLYARNKEEFTPAMTAVVENPKMRFTAESKTYGHLQEKVRIFSLRGAHLIGMFARTKLAAEFRRWVLDILDQYTAQLPQNTQETLLPSEQQTLTEIVHKEAEGYGEAQGKVLAEIWSRLHNKFRVAKYSQLLRTQLAEAILYVTEMDIRTVTYEAPRLSHAQRLELSRAAGQALAGAHRECGEGGEQWVYNRLRVRLNLRHIEDMHPSQLPEALAELEQLKRDLSAYFSFRAELREFLCREVIGAGTPWTPNVAKKWKAQLKEVVPERPDWLAIWVRLLKK
jgi:prophage antirepressor-like protein